MKLATFSDRIHYGGWSVTRVMPCTLDLALCGVLILLQVLDFFLTLQGVSQGGLEAEANPLIRWLMYFCGPVIALSMVKLGACGFAVTLTRLGTCVGWITEALIFLILVYLIFAVIPWTILLLF